VTNTLHRFGPASSFRDDYVVFAICSRGKNDKDALPKLRQFLSMAIPFKPVNLGDARHGGCLRPSNEMSPFNHWTRDMTPDLEEVVRGLDAPTTVAAVFDNRAAAVDFLKKVKEADLGMSINISTSVENAEACCHEVGIPRHSVGYSLGFEGKTEKLPNTQTMLPFAGEENDRLGEGRPAHAGTGRDVHGPFLFLRRVQSQPRQARVGRRAPFDEITSKRAAPGRAALLQKTGFDYRPFSARNRQRSMTRLE